MRLFTRALFLTLVVTQALAAPSTPTPSPGPISGAEVEPGVPPADRLETIQISEPPPLSGNSDSTPLASPPRPSHPHPDWRFDAHLGWTGGSILKSDETHQSLLLGAAAAWTSPASQQIWDFGVDVTASRLMLLRVGRRWELTISPEYQPYWKVQLQQTLESDRLLAGFVDLNRLKAGGGIGLADMSELGAPLNAELILAWGLIGIGFSLNVGWEF